MDTDRSEELERHHNQGQTDAANGTYNPPHSINPGDRLIWSDETIEKMEEDNEAYDSGYQHGRSQL
jgi:hypothetical protein